MSSGVEDYEAAELHAGGAGVQHGANEAEVRVQSGAADRTVAAGSGDGSEGPLSAQDQAILEALLSAEEEEEEAREHWHAALVAGSKGIQLWRNKRLEPPLLGPAFELELIEESEGWHAVVRWPSIKSMAEGRGRALEAGSATSRQACGCTVAGPHDRRIVRYDSG